MHDKRPTIDDYATGSRNQKSRISRSYLCSRLTHSSLLRRCESDPTLKIFQCSSQKSHVEFGFSFLVSCGICSQSARWHSLRPEPRVESRCRDGKPVLNQQLRDEERLSNIPHFLPALNFILHDNSTRCVEPVSLRFLCASKSLPPNQ